MRINFIFLLGVEEKQLFNFQTPEDFVLEQFRYDLAIWLFYLLKVISWGVVLLDTKGNKLCPMISVLTSGECLPMPGKFPINNLVNVASIINSLSVLSILNHVKNYTYNDQYHETLRILRVRKLL